jgi:hypothetical protein
MKEFAYGVGAAVLVWWLWKKTHPCGCGGSDSSIPAISSSAPANTPQPRLAAAGMNTAGQTTTRIGGVIPLGGLLRAGQPSGLRSVQGNGAPSSPNPSNPLVATNSAAQQTVPTAPPATSISIQGGTPGGTDTSTGGVIPMPDSGSSTRYVNGKWVVG